MKFDLNGTFMDIHSYNLSIVGSVTGNVETNIQFPSPLVSPIDKSVDHTILNIPLQIIAVPGIFSFTVSLKLNTQTNYSYSSGGELAVRGGFRVEAPIRLSVAANGLAALPNFDHSWNPNVTSHRPVFPPSLNGNFKTTFSLDPQIGTCLF
jgi:hypothetical protein